MLFRSTIGATKWHLVTSTYTYITAVYENLGPIVVGLGVVTIVWATVSRFHDSAIWALLVLMVAAGRFRTAAEAASRRGGRGG